MSLAVYLRIVVPMYRRGEESPGGIARPWPLVTLVWLITLVLTLGIGLAAQGLLGQLG